MSLLEKEAVKRVQKSMNKFDEKQAIIILNSSARTALEAASSLGCEVGAIVKSLLFKTGNKFTLCLVAGDRKASLNKIKKILNIKDVSMATAVDVKNISGFTIGGVSPIGKLNKNYVEGTTTMFGGKVEFEGPWVDSGGFLWPYFMVPRYRTRYVG